MKDPFRSNYGMVWHEAAHGVVRAALALPLDEIRFWTDESGTWSDTLPPLGEVGPLDRPALIATLAGRAMEELLFGSPDDDYHAGGGDWERARRLLVGQAEDSVRRVLETAAADAKELLSRYEAAVENVVELAFHHGGLPGNRVADIVRGWTPV
jgi:hypothetical protein